MRFTFAVTGTPLTQGSKRNVISSQTHRTVMLDDNPHLKAWREAIAVQARRMARVAEDTLPLPRHRPVRLVLGFSLSKPSSAPRSVRTWPVARRDLDKLTRAVMDALTGTLYTDDGQVVQLVADKDYPIDGWTGVVITMETL